MKKLLLITATGLLNFSLNSQIVTTFAGDGSFGGNNGIATAASFSQPIGVARDGVGNIYVVDKGNFKIRKINPAGIVSDFAGDGIQGDIDGAGSAARFNYPCGVAVDGTGNVYVADINNHKIKKITTLGVVTTFAGDGMQGSVDGIGTSARFNRPSGVAVDYNGNVFVADLGNRKIRKITSVGLVSTLAGDGIAGFADGIGTFSRFEGPYGIAVDATGNVYVADKDNHTIRKIYVSALVTTIAGDVNNPGNLDGLGTTASFNGPTGLVIDDNQNIYVADNLNHEVRKIDPNGVVTTVAGNIVPGAVDAVGTNASFNFPFGVTVDGAGDVYVADANNNKIRKIELCILPASPINVSTNQEQGCCGNPVVLMATGVGTITWYTSPTGGSAINTGTNYVVPTLNTNTTYYVEDLTCGPSATRTAITVTVTPCVTSIDEIENENYKLSIFPNPNNGEFIIGSNKMTRVNIINNIGEVIKVVNLDWFNAYQTKVSLPNGIYFLIGNNSKSIQRVVVTQ